MFFANPWGLLGLLSLPAILAIHLYHRRFPPMLVGGLHLWGAESEVRAAGRRRDRLPITLTLLLELLAALLLTLLWSQPRLGGLQGVRHLVVVLDNSASMQAKPSDGPSFRERAIAQLEERVETLGPRGVVTLIMTGHRPVRLAGPAVSWEVAREKLVDWQPAAPAHDFHPAWDLASQLVEDSGELLFFTDHVPGATARPPRGMEVVSVGQVVDNVAITAARWTFSTTDNTGRVFLRVSNLGREAVSSSVKAAARGQTVFSKSLTLDPGETLPMEAPLSGGLGEVTVSVETPGDGLELDNRVTLIEPKPRRVHVAIDLPESDSAYEMLERVLGSMPDLELSDVENAHLVIQPGDRLPVSRSDLWWLGIGPLDRSAEAQKAAVTFRDSTPYVLEKRNPLLEGVVLGGIFWGGAQKTDLALEPLIRYDEFPLYAALRGTRTRGYLLNIDFAKSNLQNSPDWPILMNNLLEARRDNLPGLRRWNYRVNEGIQFRLFEEGTGDAEVADRVLELVHDDTEREIVRMPIVELPPLQRTGVYIIRDGEQEFGKFALNYLDEAESDLGGLRSGVLVPESEEAVDLLAVDNPFSWAIILGIGLILAAVIADWFVLKPKALS